MSLKLILLVAIVALNGFFAGAELAIVSARRARLHDLAERGSVPARAALDLLSKPERLLSVTQVGVTLASLGLGWAGEPTLFEIFAKLFHPLLTPAREPILHGISFGLAFLTISYFHVVIGEVVPKNLAIAKADSIALAVAPVLLIFERISAPFVSVVEKSSALVCSWMGVASHGHGGHSLEEVKFILDSSKEDGFLNGFEHSAAERLLQLRDISTREIMRPRRGMVSVSVEASLDELLKITLEHKFSRLPVYQDKPENIIGTVHYKDLMAAWQERKIAADRGRPVRPFRLRRYVREPLVVPESKPLDQLIDQFRASRIHQAVVVDEFGTVTGLVTLEDVLEQIFGAMGDEHDDRRPVPVAGAPIIEVEGSTSIRQLASQYGVELPGDAGFETLAGFILFQLGYIPAPGDSVTHGARTFTVQDMDRNRISKVKIVTRAPEPAVQE